MLQYVRSSAGLQDTPIIIWKFGRFELGGGVPIRTDLDGRHPVLVGVPMFENERFESDQMMSYQGIRLNGRSDRA